MMFTLTTAQRRLIGEWLREPVRQGSHDNRVRVFVEETSPHIEATIYPDYTGLSGRTFHLQRERVAYPGGWWQWFVADPETREPIAFGPMLQGDWSGAAEEYGAAFFGRGHGTAWDGSRY